MVLEEYFTDTMNCEKDKLWIYFNSDQCKPKVELYAKITK